MKTMSMALGATLALLGCGGTGPQPVAAPPAPPSATVAPPIAPDPPLAPDAGPPLPASSLADLVAANTKIALEAFNAHDRKKLASTYAEGATVNVFGEEDLTGREAIANEFAQTLMALPDLKVVFARTWRKNDVEAIEWIVTGGAASAKDRPTGLVGFSVFTFGPDGLVTSEHRYRDTPTMMKQLGFAQGDARTVALPQGAAEAHVARGTPDEDANLASLARWYDLFDGHKADAFALLADDVALDDYTAEAPMTGRKTIQRTFGSYWKAFPDMKEEASRSFAVEDFTVSEVVLHGTQKGALGPMKASNKAMAMHQADVVQWKDGKMVHGWVYGNAKEMFDQLGAPKKAGAKKK